MRCQLSHRKTFKKYWFEGRKIITLALEPHMPRAGPADVNSRYIYIYIYIYIYTYFKEVRDVFTNVLSTWVASD